MLFTVVEKHARGSRPPQIKARATRSPGTGRCWEGSSVVAGLSRWQEDVLGCPATTQEAPRGFGPQAPVRHRSSGRAAAGAARPGRPSVVHLVGWRSHRSRASLRDNAGSDDGVRSPLASASGRRPTPSTMAAEGYMVGFMTIIKRAVRRRLRTSRRCVDQCGCQAGRCGTGQESRQRPSVLLESPVRRPLGGAERHVDDRPNVRNEREERAHDHENGCRCTALHD
jgi:hypothetical protein